MGILGLRMFCELFSPVAASPFFLKTDFAKPIPLREKHAQCVKKSGCFTGFLSGQKDCIFVCEGIFHFRSGMARAVAASLPWHGFGYEKS